eukprot:3890265-Alexandrium_andersonii.AAC.1
MRSTQRATIVFPLATGRLPCCPRGCETDRRVELLDIQTQVLQTVANQARPFETERSAILAFLQERDTS